MYNRPRIIPCLLISDGGLVKTKKFKKPNYLGDPINAVKIFNEEEADELCLLDISSHRNGINWSLLKDVTSEAFMPLAYGGGISSIEEVKRLYRLGFEKIIFNTALVKNTQLVREAVEYAGAQSVVASIDVKSNLFRGRTCYIACGEENTYLKPLEHLKRIEELGVGEILLNSIDNDGMMCGYDLDLIKIVADNTSLPVVACGGAGRLEDLEKTIKEGHAHAVAAGSLFVYYGARNAVLINYPKEEELKAVGLY